MAKEWYLMNTNHDMTSGFESDDFDNFTIDGFLEALQTSMGSSVEICNYDLSVRTPQRVILNGSVQDSKLNTITRQMLAPIGTCRAGQYVYYKDYVLVKVQGSVPLTGNCYRCGEEVEKILTFELKDDLS